MSRRCRSQGRGRPVRRDRCRGVAGPTASGFRAWRRSRRRCRRGGPTRARAGVLARTLPSGPRTCTRSVWGLPASWRIEPSRATSSRASSRRLRSAAWTAWSAAWLTRQVATTPNTTAKRSPTPAAPSTNRWRSEEGVRFTRGRPVGTRHRGGSRSRLDSLLLPVAYADTGRRRRRRWRCRRRRCPTHGRGSRCGAVRHRAPHEVVEERELAGGELDVMALPARLVLGRVQDQVAVAQLGGAARSHRAAGARGGGRRAPRRRRACRGSRRRRSPGRRSCH